MLLCLCAAVMFDNPLTLIQYLKNRREIKTEMCGLERAGQTLLFQLAKRSN